MADLEALEEFEMAQDLAVLLVSSTGRTGIKSTREGNSFVCFLTCSVVSPSSAAVSSRVPDVSVARS